MLFKIMTPCGYANLNYASELPNGIGLPMHINVIRINNYAK